MIRVLAIIALSAVVTSHSYAQTNPHNQDYYKIKNITVKEVTEQIPPSTFQVASDCTTLSQAAPTAAADMISPEQIINIGKEIWKIIEAGKPAINTKFDTANALPVGVKCWTDLQGWSAPKYKTYNVQYKNGFDMTVVDFTYRVMYTPNGNLNGVGQYITNAQVIPASLTVAWGFDFSVIANIPAVTNIGTTNNPVAAMQMNVQWTLDSTVTHIESTQSYFITGEGAFQSLK
ncbi:hypothetical protein B9G69_003880 [Bdellovibrio sp. SKB1291214]|uniref:hypothetical protein n=1 Tax=Bdellovibrio sp. SKB1291214 TaxID=1732569 RepID=UPI00223F7107|nr:hypothetical protein [Bdellovibrio sp. SKB1291214]UYL09713.1 hypothetical protein B9G69_003880 [Bdellovibrio sp. SKB1291214]